MKSDFRLGRNFYKGVFGDAVNALLAAAAYNFKRAMRFLWTLVEKISETLYWKNVSLEYTFFKGRLFMNRDISREGNSFNKYGSSWSQ